MSVKNMVRKICLLARRVPTIDKIVRKFFQVWFELPFDPIHYYSPLPDAAGLGKRLERWYRESELRGIRLRLSKQVELLHRLAAYASEVDSLPSYKEVSQQGYGQGYGEIEAQILYLVLRMFKPTRVIEVGSGVSTFFALHALMVNEKMGFSSGRMTCIEPYPSKKLRELCQCHQVELICSEVQDVPRYTFGELGPNDVLFIDSSHVSKKDSDVDYLYLEVIPCVSVGVLIHIHDIPFPMPAPPFTHPLFNRFFFWNESSLVQAFLLFNSAFEPVLCESYLHFKAPHELKKILPRYDPAVHFPSSLWLQRINPDFCS